MPVASRRPRPARRHARVRIALAALTSSLLAVAATPAGALGASPVAWSAVDAASTFASPQAAWGAAGALGATPPGLLGVPPLASFAAATPSGYAPLGDVSRREAFTDQVSRATAVDQPGRRAALIGALGVGVVADTPLRAGGSGALTISLSRQVDRPMRVRSTRLAIRIPSNYRTGGVSAPGWRCDPVRRDVLRCAAPEAVSAGSHAAVRVGLVARRAGRARVTVRASWREDRAASANRAVAGAPVTGPATAAARAAASAPVTGRAAARARALSRPRTATGSETLTVRAPLALRLRTAHRRVLGDGAGVDSPPIVLSGRLGRYDAGLPVDYRWRQLPGGPRVRWVSPAAGRASGRAVTAQVAPPAVSRPVRLRFALTARDWRGSDRATTSVIVLPHRATRLAPRDRLRVVPRRAVVRRGHVTRHRVTRSLELSGSALAGPRAGQRVTLHARPQGGDLQQIRWSVAQGPRSALAGRATDRRTLAFTVPAGARQLTIAARAVVSGHVVRTRAVIHVTAALRRPGLSPALARAAQDEAGDEADEDARPFCALWAAASEGAAAEPIELRDGSRFTLGTAVAGGEDCDADDARIAFTTGRLELGEIEFTDVAGTVTPSGIRFSAGWLALPEGWSDELPSRLRVAPSFAGAWGAALDDEGWGSLRVQISIAGGVELLPLPEGWTFPEGESTLAYVPAETTFALHIVAQAPEGHDGRVTLDGTLTLDGVTTVTVTADRVVALHGVDGRTVALSGLGRIEFEPSREREAERDGEAGAREDEPTAAASQSAPAAPAPAAPAPSAPATPAPAAPATPAPAPAAPAAPTAPAPAGRTEEPGRDGESGRDDEARRDDREPARLTGSITLRTDPADAELALASNVAVSGATATWDADGIAVAANVRVRTSRGTFAAHASGRYVSATEWKLAIAQADRFELGDGVALEDVAGSLERRPVEEDEGDADEPRADPRRAGGDRADRRDERDARRAPADEFIVSLSGAVTGWSPSDVLTDVSVRGSLTNACAQDARGCSTRQVRLAMDVRGNAHVQQQTVGWYGTASVNLATFALRFEGGAQLQDFGPEALHLADAQLRLTNDGPQWCRPADEPAAQMSATTPTATTTVDPRAATRPPEQPAAPATLQADQELALSVAARGRVLGEPFQAAGEFARSGWCLTGAFGEFMPDGLPAGRGSAPLVDEVRIAYASKAADVVVAGRAVRLSAGQVRLTGALNLPAERLPQDLRGALGRRADLSLSLTRTRGSYGLSGAAIFTFGQPVHLIGSAQRADQTRLAMTSAELSFDYSAETSLRLEMAAKAALQTPANEPRGVAASRTPLFLAAGVNLAMPSVSLSAGVDTTDPLIENGTVRNAFGQQGLDVRRLLVSASLGADTSLGIAADATLPDGWTRALGMPDRTPAKVAFSVSQTNACVELEIGQLPAVLGGPGSSAPIMRLGPLAANWAQIVVAPTGCTIGNPSPGKPGYKIDPGFALGFDGQVGPTPVTFAAAMRKHGVADFAVRGTVRVGAFDAGPVSFRRTSLDLDIDTGGANRHVDVAFAGGLDAGESTIDVEGRFKADDTQISALLRGNGRLRFADTTFAQGSVDASLEFAKVRGSWTARSANVSARTQILGAEAGLLLSYRDGAVATAAGAFQYRATVGPLGMQAGALFAYAPAGVRLDGDPRDCSISRLTPERGAKELIVRLCSRMQLGPLSREQTMTVSLPQQWDFDFAVPRSEVGVYLASVYMQGELRSSLRIGLDGLKFWVRSGSAKAGGCVYLFWWDKCANGIDVAFKPWSGRFEGSFLGIGVSWGSDSWRSSPAPGPDEQREQIGPGDRVLVGRADRIAVETSAGNGRPPRTTTFQPAAGGVVPPGMIFDLERRELMVTVPLTPAARADVPKPARAYLLVFRGVEYWRDEPLTSMAIPPEGGEPRPTVAYAGVTVTRVPDSGQPVTEVLEGRGGFLLTEYGKRLRWTARGDAQTRRLAAEGLPLGVTIDTPTAQRRAQSRAALQRATT